jgi:DNA mismatch repair protein MutL
LSNIDSGLPGTQQLLFPQQIDFSASDFSLVQELMPTLISLGFSIQVLSGFSAIISGVPSEVRVGEEKEVLLDLIHDFHEMRGERSLTPNEKAAVALAKRTAIPRGKKLSQLEMDKLIDELFACDQPMMCPQGKPTLKYISLDEIRLRFK